LSNFLNFSCKSPTLSSIGLQSVLQVAQLHVSTSCSGADIGIAHDFDINFAANALKLTIFFVTNLNEVLLGDWLSRHLLLLFLDHLPHLMSDLFPDHLVTLLVLFTGKRIWAADCESFGAEDFLIFPKVEHQIAQVLLKILDAVKLPVVVQPGIKLNWREPLLFIDILQSFSCLL